MITPDLSNDEGKTSNKRFDVESSNPSNTPTDFSINDPAETRQTATDNPGQLGLKSTSRSQSPISSKEIERSSPLMEAFISYTKHILNEAEGDYISAADSGKIVVSCKSYLNSLVGDKVARRYIATTMLVVRNNYSELNAEKRAKIVDFLGSYHHSVQQHDTIHAELKKLYGSGIRPLA